MSRISLKTSTDIEVMAEGGKIAAQILSEIESAVRPGISADILNGKTEALIKKHGVKAAFLGYENFPGSICVSINDEVVHGIPSKEKILKEGDIVGLDFGLIYKGWVLDLASTVPVMDKPREEWEKENPEKARFISITQKALFNGIKEAKAGNHLGAISSVIQKTIESAGYSVVRELVGHGVGKALHEEPKIPNYGSKNDGPQLEPGMVLAIEPMSTMGGWKVKTDKDGTYRISDGSLSAHFEHTIAITEKGPRILTL